MAQFSEIGVSGLTQHSGYVAEEQLAELSYSRWQKVLKNMLTNDAVICSLNTVIEMLARQVPWKITPANDTPEAEKVAAFYEECLFKDMEMTWQETLSEVITFLQWGWSFHEIVYKRRNGDKPGRRFDSKYTDGRIGWRKFAGRSQDTLDRWEFDGEDAAIALIQRSPNTGDTFTIPIEKALHFRTTAAKNNPEGRSMYRGAYRSWYFKSRIENIEAIGIERDLAGLPIMYVPPEILKTNATADQVALRETLKSALRSVRRDENEGVMMPAQYDENKNPTFKFELLSTGGRRQFDTSGTITRYDQRILMTGLADFLLLGSQRVGSYALSTDKTSIFATALEGHLDSVCEKFNNDAFPDLGKLNAINPELLPKLEHGQVDKISLLELCEAVSKMSGSGVMFSDEQQAWLTNQVGMPGEPETNKNKLKAMQATATPNEQKDDKDEQ